MRQLSDAEIEAVRQATAAEIEARWHDVLEMTRVAYDERGLQPALRAVPG